MFSIFLPNEQIDQIFDLKPENLKKKGIKGIITDLDNTLVAWDVKDATPDIITWLQTMEENDIKVTIISNNNQERVTVFSEPLGTPFVFRARKPLTRAFKLAAKQMKLKKEEILVVGDQLLTDVLGGNLAGFYTVLVVPVVQTDEKITRINRFIERRILKRKASKDRINREE
ncbi:YqeG family HAD IIIA-type phosphatase [Oceanobacillus sp. CFH 90083]|uniref:YqeG family HAD IIIA-type phosphatase n=1 Tax=Oceanobacillus sp. CFH 90083 TaxID=2592336 RepID=UPI00128C4E5D|nr:YqeG family HAD IIIA-type phosphatase [Oceanobacillus sp. CFH 90083]